MPTMSPVSVRATAATKTAISVAWAAPESGTIPTSYEVRVDGGTAASVGLVNSHNVTGLEPNTTYQIEVRAVSGDGPSPWVAITASTVEYLREHYYRPIRNGEGKLIVNATVAVYKTGTQSPVAPIYSDAMGEAKRGPAWVVPDGVVDFYLDRPTVVDISVTPVGATTPVVFRNQWVGDIFDVDLTNDLVLAEIDANPGSEFRKQQDQRHAQAFAPKAVQQTVEQGRLSSATLATEQKRLVQRFNVHPLAIFHAALAMRFQRPCTIAVLGSSTPWGAAASIRETEFTSLMLRGVQAAHPSRIPGVEASPKKFSESTTPLQLPTVQLFNGAVSGTNSGTYVQSLTLLGIANVDPALIIHMIGSNDAAASPPIAPDVYKANVAGRVDQITTQQNNAGRPTCHVLVHTFRRWNVTQAAWAEYGRALREIADERDNVLFVDLNDQFEMLDLYGLNAFGVMSPDTVHMADPGHALMAKLLLNALQIGAAAEGDPTLVLADSFTRMVGAPGAAESPANRPYQILSGTYEAGGGQLRHLTGGTILIDSGVADADVSALINTGQGASLAGLLFRADSEANRLGIFINRTSQLVSLYRGTTILKSEQFASSAETNYYVRAVPKGDRIVSFINGAKVLDHTLDATDAAAYAGFTKVGFRCGTPTTGLHYRGLAVRRI